MDSDKVVECYCCKKEYKFRQITEISATTSGKCQDGTRAEDRFVCDNCNHLNNKGLGYGVLGYEKVEEVIDMREERKNEKTSS